jgi:DNA-binding transcriptional regulator YhcF (GntR family)
MSKAIFDQHTANVAKNTNVSTALSTGTVDATSYGITSDGGTDDVVLAQATTSFAGVLSAAKWDEIVANTAKSGNVSTDLSATANGTSLTVESSDGNNVALPAATTSAWGIMSDDQATKLDGIEASADVTDATNVTAAGALMDSELTDLAGVKGVTISTLQVKPSEGAFANGDKTKLDAIEASADITDTANVTSAGALMDSEVTNLADVKAFDTSDYATAAQGTKADSAQQPPTEGAFVDGDKTKLDAIEASATADQSNAEIVAAVEAGTDSNTFTDADHTKLDAIELLADVTDATNVTAAGALMDSELAGIAAVKATTGTFLTADQTKLDGIETSATADQSNAEIKTAIEAGTDIALGGNPTTTTQSAANNSTRIATTAYVDAAGGGGEANESSFKTITFGGSASAQSDVVADADDDTLTLVAGANVTITTTADQITFVATDTNTTYSVQDGELSQNNFTNTDHTKLNGIEASADVTDATNVTAAGALMDSELAGIAAVKATTGTFLSADESKLDGIEASADVTDATNVTAAGALMDSELAGIAAVKATTGTFLSADESKLDGIEASATADQTKSDIDGLAITTVGALSSGSIATGFGAIDNGSSTITTTGLISGGSLDIDGNVDLDGKLTMGGNQDGYDLKVFGNGGGTTTLSGADAANKYWFWDESVDGMRLRGNFVQEQVPYTNTPSAIGTGISIIDIDWQLGNYYWIKLGDTHIDKIIFRNMKRGGKYILRIQQASPYRTVAWTALKNTDVVPDPDDSSDHFTEVRWVGGDAPTMSTGTTSTDVYGFLCTRSNGKGMDCFVVAQDLQEDGDH